MHLSWARAGPGGRVMISLAAVRGFGYAAQARAGAGCPVRWGLGKLAARRVLAPLVWVRVLLPQPELCSGGSSARRARGHGRWPGDAFVEFPFGPADGSPSAVG